EAVRRVLRTTIDDLLELSWAATHGEIASRMQAVAFTPATAIAAIFNATGQDLGMVGTSSMAHGTGKRVAGGLNASIRLPGLEGGTAKSLAGRVSRGDPPAGARGRDRRGRDDTPLRPRLARADGLRRPREG